jgi:hypothetical protein
MKYATEMGSVVIIYTPSFINVCSGIQKSMGGGGGIQRETDIKLLFIFSI